jgi:hypothetical protein
MGNVLTLAPELKPVEPLETAAGYIETVMGRILVCVAALRSEGCDAFTRQAMANMLLEDHNDLDVAREILQKWKDRAELVEG